jgi:hypothetical protein
LVAPLPTNGSAGNKARHGGKAIEELIFWAEQTDGTHDDRLGVENSHRLLADMSSKIRT